jgi:hypothetical protein
VATEKIPGNGKPAKPPGNAGAPTEVFVRAWAASKTKPEVVTRLKALGYHVTLGSAQQRAGMLRRKGVKLPSFGYGGRSRTDVAALNAILAEGKSAPVITETITEPVSMSAQAAQDVPGRVERSTAGSSN